MGDVPSHVKPAQRNSNIQDDNPSANGTERRGRGEYPLTIITKATQGRESSQIIERTTPCSVGGPVSSWAIL